MLKLKDNVDLKELEKFGFKPKYDEDTGKIVRYVYLKPINYNKNSKNQYIEAIEVKYVEYVKNHDDFFKQQDISYWGITQHEFDVLDILYDLIQAGLVEKVEE